MTSLLRITPTRRLYCLGLRVHHGPVGVLLAVLGLVLAVHDRRDVWVWLRLRDPEGL